MTFNPWRLISDEPTEMWFSEWRAIDWFLAGLIAGVVLVMMAIEICGGAA